MIIFLFAISIFLKVFIITLYFFHVLSLAGFIFVANPLSSIFLAWCFYYTKRDRLKSLFVLALDTFLPIVGFLCIFLFSLLRPLYRLLYRRNEIDVYDIPFGDENYEVYDHNKKIELQAKSLDLDEEIHEHLEILPFREILDGTNRDLKISAIDKLSRLESRESIKVLKEALLEDEYEVRYFANNALGKIEKRLLEKIETLSEEIRLQGELTQSLNSRGGLYLDIYMLDILDSEMGKLFLERALNDFLLSLSMDASQKEIFSKIVQTNLFLKEYQEVIQFSKDALKFELSSTQKCGILFYMAEAYYELGLYHELSESCKEIKNLNPKYEKINQVANWWANA